MKKITILLSFLIFLGGDLLHAQDIGYGFKAGLNFSSFQGDSEQDIAGNDLENFTNNTGFQIGGIINFKFTDAFGLRTEILFSQKGGRYSFTGDSYQRLYATNGETVRTTGMKEITLNVTNAYIDIPVMGYIRVAKWLELSAGPNIGFLIASSGAGELRYNGAISTGKPIEEFVVSLEHRYFSDEAGEAKLINEDPIVREGFNNFIEIPKGFGAYYDYEDADEKGLYNIIDFGLNAGLAIYLNQGLSLGVRFNYGLADITKNTVDRSQVSLNENNGFILRDDFDRNLSAQATLGFSF